MGFYTMSIEIKAPQFPESVADGTVLEIKYKQGDSVKRDQVIVEIETDKVVLEVLAPEDGQLTSLSIKEGDVVESQQIIAQLTPGAVDENTSKADTVADTVIDTKESNQVSSQKPESNREISESVNSLPKAGPAARKLMAEHNVSVHNIEATGKAGRITKTDVEQSLKNKDISTTTTNTMSSLATNEKVETEFSAGALLDRDEKRVPMTRLRKRIAERLLTAQQSAAMLTTFNEVNMQPIMNMRKNYQHDFQSEHNVRLGFMSFFVRAAVEALKRFPSVNASIDGDDVVYHGYYDIGVAVSSNRGLVVPIIRDANRKGFPEIETQIIEYGEKAKSGQLTIDELTGGTFTISNGGVFGSLLSTPILNPPQTAILGMHKIQDRPMAIDGQVVILPMMYLALTYDHRLIDGKEAVQFLSTIKNFVEDPARLLLDI